MSIEKKKEDYDAYVESQRKGYEVTAAMIGYIIQRMKETSRVKGNVSISGRIKSFKSVSENAGKKAIDDCFGIRIVGNADDLKAIEEELGRILVLDSKKDHRKKSHTKYNGVHEMIHMDSEYAREHGIEPQSFPQIEVQYWSEETRQECIYGDLSYAKYKKKDLPAILARFENDPEGVFADLPMCYEIQGNNIRRLSGKEALYKLYPEIQEIEGKKEETEAEMCKMEEFARQEVIAR